MGKPTKIRKFERTHQNAADCQDAARKEENGLLGACALGAGGYRGNIFVWDSGRLLVAMPGIVLQ